MSQRLITITEAQYDERIIANQESIFFRYTDEVQAIESYSRKWANPLFNNDELFVFNVDGFGFVVQTTGSLVRMSK